MMEVARAVKVIEHFIDRIQADTGLGSRDVECIMYLLETGGVEVDDLPAMYGFNIYTYAPNG